MSAKPKDWKGRKIGKLTFIRPTDTRRRRAIVWEALCECGIQVFAAPSRAIEGQIVSCGCVRHFNLHSGETGRKYRTYDPIISSARTVWGNAYRDIDFNTFYTLSQLPCDYCGCPPSKTYNVAGKYGYATSGAFTYNGLDRVDNTKGHTADNVVPCCWPCNKMKGSLTREEFITHVKTICKHQS